MTKKTTHDRRLEIRLPAGLAATARAKARQLRRPLSDVVRELLRAWIAQQS